MARLEAQQILVLLALAYLLLLRPVRHGWSIWQEYRLVYSDWLRISRAGIEAIGVGAATLVGLAIASVTIPTKGSDQLAWSIQVLAFGYLIGEVIAHCILGLRSGAISYEGDGRRRPLLFRNRVLDHLFREAIWAKLNDKKTSVAELDAVARDPVKRAALLAEHVESTDRRGWIKIERAVAKRHEGYYRHPPVLTLLLLALVFDYLQTTIAYLQMRSYGETAELVRRSAALAFGAAFYPLPQLRPYPYLHDVIHAAPLIMVLLFSFGHQIARYALTLLIVVYFGISLVGLPEAIAQWHAHPAIVSWKKLGDMMGNPFFGTIARMFASVASDGMSEVALGAHQLWTSISPAAWFGASIALWVPFVIKLMRHMWVSEVGNLYFASRVRRPASCGASAQADVPNNIVLGVLCDKTGWRPTPAEVAQLSTGATLSITHGNAAAAPTTTAAPAVVAAKAA